MPPAMTLIPPRRKQRGSLSGFRAYLIESTGVSPPYKISRFHRENLLLHIVAAVRAFLGRFVEEVVGLVRHEFPLADVY